jgi:hypothetical protein
MKEAEGDETSCSADQAVISAAIHTAPREAMKGDPAA